MVCRDLFSRRELDDHGNQFRRNDIEDARARDDLHSHAALRLGTVCDRAAADDRDSAAAGLGTTAPPGKNGHRARSASTAKPDDGAAVMPPIMLQ